MMLLGKSPEYLSAVLSTFLFVLFLLLDQYILVPSQEEEVG
jgi:hypothetical protein